METTMTSYIIRFYKNLIIVLLIWASGLIFTYISYTNGNFVLAAIILASTIFAAIYIGLNIHLWLNNKVIIQTSIFGFHFEIEKKNEVLNKEYLFSEIEAYQFEFSGKGNNVPIFRIYKRNGKVDKYTFIAKKDDKDQVNPKLLAKSLHLNIQMYNKDKIENQKIEFRPSFAASKSGLYTIVFGGFFYFLLIIIIIILSSKEYTMSQSFLILIGGSIPFFRLLFARISAMNFRKEMMNIAEKEL